MISVKLNDRLRNEVIREECGVKEDVVTKIEPNILRWFGHVERRDTRRSSKDIYEADMGGKVKIEARPEKRVPKTRIYDNNK
jgi:hypothetical protein